MECSLLKCSKHIPQHADRVEISASKEQLAKIKSDLKIKWIKSGDAVFHSDCWEDLFKASRTRNPKNDPFKLSNTEKSIIKVAGKTAERHDSLCSIRKQAVCVAEMIKKSKYCCAFTGAGISTSAGIGDYRGKKGKWTEMDRVQTEVGEQSTDEGTSTSKKRKTADSQEIEDQEASEIEDEDSGVPYETLRPTYTHEALKQLLDLGLLKHIISQNGDGLHGLSGVPAKSISELHGNVFTEKCESCGHRYNRSYYVMDDVCSEYYEEIEDYGKTDIIKPVHAKQCSLCGLSHRTGRKCVQKDKKSDKKCKGHLMDTIINFRDLLEANIVDEATDHAWKCDLMLSLGTTMTVTPACDLVTMGKMPLRLVICNRQKTDLDADCLKIDDQSKEVLGSRIFGDCDTFMREVMKNMLDDKALKDWESGREDRMKVYDKQRDTDKSR